MILIGKGANIFAKQQGFCETDPTELLTGRELERYHQIKNDPNFIPKVAFSGKGHGTVGCVAMDKKGRVAVAVSTGGTVMKPPGRVGDTPIFGSGAYINPKGLGVAATGYGEDLIRCMISHSVYEYSLNSSSIQQATELAIDNMYKTVQGFGGVIALGKKGFGLQWNTPRMAFSVQTDTFSAFEGIEYSDKEKLLS